MGCLYSLTLWWFTLGSCGLIWLHYLLFLLLWHTIVKRQTLKVLNVNLIAHFFLSLLLLTSLVLLRLSLHSLCLRDLLLHVLIENIIILLRKKYILIGLWLFFYFLVDWFSSVQLCFNLISENRFIFLYDWWSVVDMSIAVCYDPTFPEIL